MATPINGKTFSFVQPDGTEIQVRGYGNQYYAVFETLDGYTVVKNPNNGFWEIARVSADGRRLEPAGGPRGNLEGARAGVPRGARIVREEARARGTEGALRLGGRRCDQRRQERKNRRRALRALGAPLLAPPERATVGDFVGLCLPIEFPDVPGSISRAEVERFCNQQGYAGFGNHGSVSDYFLANSIGRCRYTNIVAPYYSAQHAKSHYTDPNVQQGVRARELINEALAHHKAAGFDFTGLTADGAGLVYAMNVYYSGPVVNNWAEGLWPHAWHLGTQNPLAPGKAAFDYQFTALGNELELGTFCHENGHMLCDYPDLYDYGSESSGVGAFCLMCAGGNIDEKNPTHISAYLKRLSGWANGVTTLQDGLQVQLGANTNDFAVFAKNDDEYFLFENRQKSGRDGSLPDEGLAIWHVDEAGDNSNEQMTPAQHYELSLEQADGAFRLEKMAGQYGDPTDLFGQANQRFADSTVPSSKWWDGTSSSLDVHAISAPGAQIQFSVGQGGAKVTHLQRSSAPSLAIPDNQNGGVSDTIAIAESALITSAKVSVVVEHPYRGDLRVTLTTPWGAEFVLHERSQGGSADDLRVTYDEATRPALATLRGRSVQGAWRLRVQDLAPADVGTLVSWAVDFLTADAQPGQIVLEEAPGVHIPDNKSPGVRRTLRANAPGLIASVEVALDITHAFVGDLVVTLTSPANTTVVLHDRHGGSADDIRRTYTAATTPALAQLVGQPAKGDWFLSVADRASLDVGKLNRWRVSISAA